jgi:hypothetical protein
MGCAAASLAGQPSLAGLPSLVEIDKKKMIATNP